MIYIQVFITFIFIGVVSIYSVLEKILDAIKDNKKK